MRAAKSGAARGRRGGGQPRPKELAAWLHIGEDGTVTVFTGKVEMGQNARTSLTQVVAEELPVPLNAIRMVMGDTDLTPYDAGTFGSQTTPGMGPQLRKVAATAREALLDLGAEHFHTDRSNVIATEGKILFPKENQAIAFSELAKGKELTRTIADDVKVAPATAWKIAGTSVPKINGEALVTGGHKYTSDLSVPGMLYGKILRPPAFGQASARSTQRRRNLFRVWL